MSRLCLYYIGEPERDRWVPGDRFIRPLVRRLVRGQKRPGGLDKVFINLCLGLDRLGIAYEVNRPFRQLHPADRVAVLGRGRHCLDGYRQANRIIAGIGLMTDPSEWPTLCEDYPVVRYLQHSAWCDAVYRPFFGDRCAIWPVGIDTRQWAPAPGGGKSIDFLIYDKFRWPEEWAGYPLLPVIRTALLQRGLSFEEIRYGHYAPADFHSALMRCRAMIFLCSHESQGIAAQEAMACGVPLLAWDQGWVLDPERHRWHQKEIPATSVPYFDERCGLRFKDGPEFIAQLPEFVERLQGGGFDPRSYILENLTVEKCSRHFVEIVNDAQQVP